MIQKERSKMPIRLPENLTQVQKFIPPGINPIIGNLVRNKLEPKPVKLVPPEYETQKYSKQVNLSDAMTLLRKKGVSKSNRYLVLLSLPRCLEDNNEAPVFYTPPTRSQNTLTYADIMMTCHTNCEAAELPGIQIATQDQILYALTEKIPYQMMYEDVTLTYRCDDQMREKKYFDAWINGIRNPVNGNIKYRKNYTADIEIIQLDMINRAVYTVTLLDAFPTSVSQIPMGYDHQNAYHKLTVTFSYKKYITFGEMNQLPKEVQIAEQKAGRSLTAFQRAGQEFGKLASSHVGSYLIKKTPIGNVPGLGSISDVSAKIYGLF